MSAPTSRPETGTATPEKRDHSRAARRARIPRHDPCIRGGTQDLPTKRCARCHDWKAEAAFTQNRHAPDGLQPECRDCMKAYRQRAEVKRRERERERTRVEYHRESKRLPEERAKSRVRHMTRKAVRDGVLTKPDHCEGCQRQLPPRLIHAHHRDYSNPLDVAWYCPHCHAAVHHHPQERVA